MMKHINLKPFILGVLPLILLYTIITAFFYIDYKIKKSNFSLKATSNLNNEINLILNGYRQFSDFLYNNNINKPEITDLIYESYIKPETKDRNREILREKLLPLYEEIKKTSYRQLHFHLPDTESFLRMHRPEKYGDKLSEVRETVRITNLNKKASVGFEEGRIFNGYRYVYPLFSGGMHAGSVEISVSYEAVIQSLEKLFNKNYIFILKKEVVDKKVFTSEKSNYSEFCLNNNFLIDKDIDKTKTYSNFCEYRKNRGKSTDILKHKLDSGENFIQAVINRETESLFIAVKITNVKGDHAGYLLSIESAEDYIRLKKNMVITLILFSVIIMLIIILVGHFIWVRIKFEEMATYDKLTSLYNRHMFLELFRQILARMKRANTSSIIIMADIDHFKKINDKYGHNCGDRVLQQFAKIIKENIRESDIPSRWGGEEFIILLPKTTLDNGIKLAEKIRQKIELADFGIKKQVTCSFGVSEINDYESDITSIIERADKVLYKSKSNGRNRVEW